MKIQFKRLLEIFKDKITPTEDDKKVIWSFSTVYVITNDKLNLAYIGETSSTHYRIFDIWKEDKRHVDGELAPIHKFFEDDYENTYFEVLEEDCDHKIREHYWDKWYRENTNYKVVSTPGRLGNINNHLLGRHWWHDADIDKGYLITDEQAEVLISQGINLVRGTTDKHRRNTSIGTSKAINTPEVSKKSSEARRGMKRSEECRRRQSERFKAQLADPIKGPKFLKGRQESYKILSIYKIYDDRYLVCTSHWKTKSIPHTKIIRKLTKGLPEWYKYCEDNNLDPSKLEVYNTKYIKECYKELIDK